MGGRALFVCALSVSFGIVLSSFYTLSLPFLYFLLTGGVVAIGCGTIRKKSILFFTTLALIFIFFALGSIRMEHKKRDAHAYAPYLSQEVRIEGKIVREPDRRERATLLTIQPYDESSYILVFASSRTSYAYGENVAVSGVLEEPKSFETDTEKVFDYANFLHAHNISAVIYEPQEINGDGSKSKLAFIFYAKSALEQAIKMTLSAPYDALALGMLLGEKRALSDSLQEDFRDSGIIHIVVLSGYNILLIVIAIGWVASFFPRKGMRILLSVLALFLFVVMVGPSPSVLRATIMALLSLFALYQGRSASVTRALAFAFLIMVLWEPYVLLYDPGFALSFLATIGVVVVAPLIESRVSFLPQVAGMRTIVSATIATQLLVAPYLLSALGSISIVSVVTNILVVPLVPFAMLSAFIAGCLTLIFPGVAVIFGAIATPPLFLIMKIAEVCSSWSYATIAVPYFPWWATVGVYIGGSVILFFMIKPPYTPPETDEMYVLQSKYKEWTIVDFELPTLQKKEKSSPKDIPSFPFR